MNLPRTLSQRDFDRFAALTRDANPVHVDPAFARTTHLGATVAPGMFLFALISAAISQRLQPAHPRGWLPLSQTLTFPAPTFVGDTVTVSVAAASGETGAYEVGIANQQRQPTATGYTRIAAAGSDYRPVIDDELNRTDLDSDTELLGLALGQQASAARVFEASDLDEYVDLSGDRNPLVALRAAARDVGLPDRLLAAPLLGGMLSDLLGAQLPGLGTGWVRQSLAFHSPSHAGQRLTATVTVTRLRRDKQLVNLGCLIAADDGRSIATGEALVLVRNLAQRPAA
ncbi:MAG TPA: MaoC/PaaZ C-terminal domain-containing protein [Burkholderiaceae bacterium]|nr:MaoC/PaaZ C-terminal domain-containing protein [Burkholderiaceae bacterium]